MTVENQTPIKERLLADIRREVDRRGRYPNPVSVLGKRYGLNHHDLQKNLFQLEKEGYLRVEDSRGGSRASEAGIEIKRIKLRRGAMNEQLLKEHKPLTVADKVRQWILRAPQQRDGWVHATPTQIREAIKSEGNTASVAISDMQRHGELEVRKEGHRIVAMRMIAKAGTDPVRLKRTDRGASPEQITASTYEEVVPPPTASLGGSTTNGPAPEMPATPNLNQYMLARSVWKVAPVVDNPYIHVEFREDPIAEEAIMLKRRLEAVLQ
jgi:hypothetical protein